MVAEYFVYLSTKSKDKNIKRKKASITNLKYYSKIVLPKVIGFFDKEQLIV
jgi:hypothetical protein